MDGKVTACEVKDIVETVFFPGSWLRREDSKRKKKPRIGKRLSPRTHTHTRWRDLHTFVAPWEGAVEENEIKMLITADTSIREE